MWTDLSWLRHEVVSPGARKRANHPRADLQKFWFAEEAARATSTRFVARHRLLQVDSCYVLGWHAV